ncbi:hypothetical protein BJX68DRAFT_260346 [Aspergillus pseudodeflectus]|uniref:Uncharacterized protein n=1 Tax=Aspergillus pseudodeflectus TaxID=176178 RepID=A0ABR4LB07_9EURO
MPPFGETIAVIDKSGQVVSTSKHLFGVFNQAKNAYRERKAQVQSERNAKIAEKIAEREALKALQNYTIDDSPSVASSRRSRSRHHQSSHRHHHRSRAGSVYEQDLHSSPQGRAESIYGPPGEMVRRHTHHDIAVRQPEDRRPPTSRSKSDAHIDMDLAYGEFHPSAIARQPSPRRGQQLQTIDDPELSGLVTRAQWLLEEANCVQHTATATISHLQKNPDAMAAVALTLAEISNLATKMAPSALAMLKTAAPAVWALLASPQFLIAAGVGLTATIVMFGGYKIVKQMQSSSNNKGAEVEAVEHSAHMDEMIEFNTDCLSSVEMWRRGVADAEAESAGTSVDGEFITPRAAMMSGIDVTTARLSRDPRFKFDDDESRASSRRSRRSRAPRAHHAPSKADTRAPESVVSSRSKKAPSKASSKAPSRAPSKTASQVSSTAESRHSEKDKKSKDKKKRPSRLRLMFRV